MKDIQLGDKVIDGLGNETEVIGIYPQGKKSVYKITFSDRTSTFCSDEHLWKVGWYSNKQASVKWSNLTVKELLDRGLKKRNNTKGWKFRIPIPVINCWNNEVPLDPYLLGVLLGDGNLSSSNGIKLSLYEDDLKSNIDRILKDMQYELHLCNISNPVIKDYNIVRLNNEICGFAKYIEDLDLICKSIEKHIPKEYLYTTVENRIKLLQGLFDTDGYIDSHNNYIYTTSSPQLSEDFAFLVRSLGGTDTVIRKPSGYKHNGIFINCQDHYDHYIKFNKDFKFCTTLKHISKIKGKQNNPQRRITNIEYIDEEECQCILVQSEDHTYMTNDLIVTHNTTTCRIVANMINEGKGVPFELDCASHNGVDDMRAIQQDCMTRPLEGKYKIFILDEVHMLSTAAWNSMLKILEEPPEYVVFLFATTDPQKILPTILSRVQRFNFSRISTEGIIKRLIYILQQENITTYEIPAVEYIARLAKGGMRDAITTLEKCLDYDINLTLDNVHKVTSGGVDEATLLKLLRLLLDKNSKEALIEFQDIYMSGIDTSLFLKLFIEYVENCIKYLITNNANITPLSDTSLTWLNQNGNFEENMRNILTGLISIKTNYLSEDLKIIIESWIIEECNS